MTYPASWPRLVSFRETDLLRSFINIEQLVQEIETRAIASQQQLSITKAQITAKQRDVRLLELTAKELSSLPRNTNVYEGVGKMYVRVG